LVGTALHFLIGIHTGARYPGDGPQRGGEDPPGPHDRRTVSRWEYDFYTSTLRLGDTRAEQTDLGYGIRNFC
jgi:hypothetical protein